MGFDQQLQAGKIGESYIANWFKNRGFNILPVYEKEISEGKGPTLFTAENKQIIATDMLIFKENKIFWIEAKHKTAFSWHRITGRWVTGIDIKHYTHYLELAKLSKWPIWLIFLQKGGHAKDSPEISPSGLYGGELTYLSRNENHRHMNHGSSGMVYWSDSVLNRISNAY